MNAQKIRLLPLQLVNVSQTEVTNGWRMTGLPGYVELSAAPSPIPAGWVLLRGVLHRHGQDFSARIIAEMQDADNQRRLFSLPVTRKGTINELIRLPEGVTRLMLEPMQSQGDFELEQFSLMPVGHAVRIVRMLRRVIPIFFKQPRSRRHRAGLRIYTLFADLQKAYRIAGRFRAYAPAPGYKKWIEKFDTITKFDRQLMRQSIATWRDQPRFEIIVPVNSREAERLEQTLQSLRKQVFRRFQVKLLVAPEQELSKQELPAWVEVLRSVCDSERVEMANAVLKEADPSTWIIVLRPGDLLAQHALYWFAEKAIRGRKTRFIYSDHDSIDPMGKRIGPVFKPDWSFELLRSTNYIGISAAVRSDVLLRAGGLSWRDIFDFDHHDLFLRVTEQIQPTAIRHIHAVLCHHLPSVREMDEGGEGGSGSPVADHLLRLGVDASVDRTNAGHFRIRYALPENPPMVSIVVPTRDALAHLRPCVESVLGKSSYPNFELIVVDNQSSDPEALAYLEALAQRGRVRVLRYAQPFNYSAINNFAAAQAGGDILCLLNNDTEVISTDWMEEMVGHLLQHEVGVVGAKLLYADGRVQHGGDTVGPGGCAHHLHSLLERDAPGYCNRAILAQDLSAVTAACLMTWRGLYADLGGLDAANLPVAFNDVDYCLRVREAGKRVVWTPHAELYHYESVSRGKDVTPQQVRRARREGAYMRKRWRMVMRHDPFYNPNLSYERADFSLSNAPMARLPWLNHR
ncbi:MAG: glycosyltransferase family 2 protein [Gammaproteobacteria bacterium]|nr:glycosyltransferase family 2 protein [Gammaproteobacteria bacterium]MBU1624003.1 glycosyltransferase family 2 protein [Gammaproteobacteria bacterium]MBU1981731.1 glycosyltransferase family 2 protein [Gammaproteobacteria bacterium]